MNIEEKNTFNKDARVNPVEKILKQYSDMMKDAELIGIDKREVVGLLSNYLKKSRD